MVPERLTELLRPPDEPFPLADGDLEAVEAALGVVLPSDYTEFVSVYGRGAIDAEVTIFVPDEIEEVLEATVFEYTELAGGSPSHRDTPIFPQPGGLLPWGGDGSGNGWFWRTSGAPDDWPVVIEESGTNPLLLTVYDLNVTSYLTAFLANELDDAVSRAWGAGAHRWVPR